MNDKDEKMLTKINKIRLRYILGRIFNNTPKKKYVNLVELLKEDY